MSGLDMCSRSCNVSPMTTTRYKVISQHGPARRTRSRIFDTYEAALAYGQSFTPDTDGSCWPNVQCPTLDRAIHNSEVAYGRKETYERGLFWPNHENRYAVIIRVPGTVPGI